MSSEYKEYSEGQNEGQQAERKLPPLTPLSRRIEELTNAAAWGHISNEERAELEQLRGETADTGTVAVEHVVEYPRSEAERRAANDAAWDAHHRGQTS